RETSFFQPDDHLVILGGGIADRMQHDGWLEAILQTETIGLNLTIRNHGFAGDRIDYRPRNKDFLGPDDYLKLSGATVIFAMFGYNESFDEDPLAFKNAISNWIQHTQSQNYSGKGPPRILLISPTAHQNLENPNFPDGSLNNPRLAAIAAAMEDVAREDGVEFIDLFTPTLHQYSMSKDAFTINGIHLNSQGNKLVAGIIADKLFGEKKDRLKTNLETLRSAVLDKNWHWHNRYRATDGNDIWGSRADLKFTDNQSNRDVLQHELSQLDVMTRNRDEVIWKIARGESAIADDENVPESIKVTTNLDKEQLQSGISKLGDGSYLGGIEAIEKMTLQDGLEVNLFASEEMFPELVNPVQLGVDPKGRMWVAAWKTYPKWEPMKEMGDCLIILPDDNRDGVADRAITFAYVHNPTGFEFWNGGVIVASTPGLIFLKDTDGDDIADVRYRILEGLDSADTHHAANNFVLGPDGFLYYQRGIFLVSNVETPWQANQESSRSGMYRFNPRTHEFSFHAENSPNPHGISFDYWGYHYATDGTGGRAFQVVSDGDGSFKMRKLLNQTVRPVASSGILSSSHFPDSFQGNFLLCNTIAFLGLKQYNLDFDTATGEVNGTEVEDLIASEDPNFRPTDLEVGDDGALYVSDWCNAIVGHMQHNVRDPERDHAHGRIYRITAKNRPLAPHVSVYGRPIPELLELLKSPINGIRHRVRVELSARNSEEVIRLTQEWASQFDIRDESDAHHLLEALWIHQQHNVKNQSLLNTLLNSPNAHARIAAQRVEGMWTHSQSKPNFLNDTKGLGTNNQPSQTPPKGAIVLQTVPEKMSYDLESFEVQAGKPVRLWFFNPDFMPHNLIIGMPDSAEELGLAAEALGAAGFNQGFVPTSEKIIASSKLLNHMESQIIEFIAPQKVGKYDYVCTFPGHWKLMQGKMIVRR
ncbi:MAG: GDSL-type esterase/lipase family protein, partial [Planctomycetota bacterium]|nr:GDSL-type esterase/lipase family protein [Planctomycetota bacterium]